VDSWDVVWQRIRRLAQFFSIVGEPTVLAKLADWAIAAHLSPKVRGEMLQLIAGVTLTGLTTVTRR